MIFSQIRYGISKEENILKENNIVFYISLFCISACKIFTPQINEQSSPTTQNIPTPMPKTIQLSTKNSPAPIPDTSLKLNISESSHKSQAPIGRVCVLVDNGTKKAETCWATSAGAFDTDWKSLGGRRWVTEKNAYEEIYIEGWEIRLDSIDEIHSNASAKTISISIRQASEE